jgi:flagellar biosynthesis protein FliP
LAVRRGNRDTCFRPPCPSGDGGGRGKPGEDLSLRVLVPAFMISELKRAFEIGFLLFLAFLIIDLVVASVLMSMGMMMLPPVVVSLPFNLIFFVLVDGWSLVAGSLIQSYGV